MTIFELPEKGLQISRLLNYCWWQFYYKIHFSFKLNINKATTNVENMHYCVM